MVLVRCDWTTDPVEGQPFVVEAFLETGRPLPAVTLKQVRPLTSTGDSLRNGVSGAEVTLTLGSSAISYSESKIGRYVPSESTVVPPQVSWHLTVKRNETEAGAGGTTSPPIVLNEVCVDVPEEPVRAVQVDSLRRDSLDIPAEEGYLYPIEVTVQWEGDPPAPENAPAYWVRTQLRPDESSFQSEVVDLFLEPAEIRREDRFSRTDGAQEWKGVYAVPVDSSNAPLPSHNLTTSVVRGDSAFASFAQTRTDPDRREPISNVDGALGVAHAVSVDSLTRVIEPGLRRCQGSP